MLYYSEDVLTISGLSKAVKAGMAIRATRVKGYHGIRAIRGIYHFVALPPFIALLPFNPS